MSSQNIMLINYLNDSRNSINRKEARDLFGIERLAARIHVIKSTIPIADWFEVVFNRDGKECRVKRYRKAVSL